MVETLEQTGAELAQFVRLYDELRNDAPPFIQSFRAASMSRFLKVGLPTPEQEEWRTTSIAPIARLSLQRGRADRVAASSIDPHRLPSAAAELVFVNGHFSPELSSVDRVPEGVIATNLRSAWIGDSQGIEEHLGKYLGVSHAFGALNGALLEDGVYINVGHRRDGGTIHVLFVSRPEEGMIVSPRLLVIVGRDAKLTLVESHLALEDKRHLVNSASEIVVGANSTVDHYRIQDHGSYRIDTTDVHQVRDSNYESHVITIGGTLSRNDLGVCLFGEGSSCTLDGLYLLDGSDHADHHTVIDHAKPHATSVELYKGVLDGKSRGVFDGKIIVRRDAQKTSARQTNKNLLLSNEAIADSKPQLEIHADDVKCNHGSTIGQIDKDAVFYLRSRGIGEREARNLLTLAFASEIVERIRVEEIRTRLQRLLLERLSKHEGKAA